MPTGFIVEEDGQALLGELAEERDRRQSELFCRAHVFDSLARGQELYLNRVADSLIAENSVVVANI